MRRVLVLVAALGAMWFLGGLSVPVIDGALHPLTLAAIGFVVLAAFTVGELGSTLGPPKVTGYIVAGVLLGPQVANILSTDVVKNLTVFNTLAIGLIATTAGLELDLKAIARVWKSLTSMVVIKIPLLLLLVGGTFYGVETFFPSLGIPVEAVIPIALIVAVLGIGTSPSVAIAVVNDSGAKGRLTELLLAIAVVKDLVVVVSLAVTLAFAKTMLMPDAVLDINVLIHVAEELGRSILVGAVLGGLLTAYIRFVHKQMLLFVLLTILVVAEISAVYHLELLLVFIVAGFLVRNATPYEHELMHPLERIALPVFVVFFTTAGANIDLITTWTILPLALAVTVARVIAFYIASRLGSAIGREPPAIRDNAWLAFLPQAGVTLGLVLLAAKGLPELSGPITTIGLALVAINLLIGPVTLGIALKRAGETPDSSPKTASETTDAELPASREPTEDTADGFMGPPIRGPRELVAPLASSEPTPLVETLAQDLMADIRRFFEKTATPAVEGIRDAALSRLPMQNDPETLVGSALSPTDMPSVGWDRHVLALYAQMATRVQELPERIKLPLMLAPPSHVERAESASMLDGVRRRVARLSVLRQRGKPSLRMLARLSIEGRLAEGLHGLFDSWYRNQAHLLEMLLRAIEHDEDSTVCRSRVSKATQAWLVQEEDALLRVVESGISAMVEELVEHASPLGHPTAPRFSTIEPNIERHVARIYGDVALWRDAVKATSEHVQAASLVAVGDARTRAMLTRWGESALDVVRDATTPRIDTTIEALNALHRRIDDPDEPSPEGGWEVAVRRSFPVSRRLAIRSDGATFRQNTQPQSLQNVMAPLVEAAPDRLRVVGGQRASRLESPGDLTTKEIRMSQRLRTILLDELVPEAGRALAPLKSRITVLHRSIAEGVEVASFGVAEAQRSTEEPNDLHGPINRAIARLVSEREDLHANIEQARERLRGEEDDTGRVLDALLDVRGTRSERMQTGVAATRRSLQSGLAGVRAFFKGLTGRVRHALSRVLDHPWLTDRAVRMGHVALDGDAMRHAIHSALPDPAVASDTLNLFALRPVDDRRLFVAHRDALARLSLLLSRPEDHSQLTALVVGRRGSGRSSLLNILQLRARERQVVRLDDSAHDRRAGLIGVLAAELHTRANEADVLEALERIRPLVLIDNLGRFLAPTLESTRRLDCVLGLVAASSAAGTEWVVTIEASLLHRLEDVLPVTRVFNQRVDLGPVDWRTLQEVIRARTRLGGIDVEHAYLSRLEVLMPGEPDERYYKALAEVSGGNLSAALHAHRGALRQSEEGALTADAPRVVRLPFVGDLSPMARALLAVLYGYGPMTRSELAHGLGVSDDELFRHLLALRESGLLSEVLDDGALISIPMGLLDSVRMELVRHRQISAEGVR